MKLLLKSKIVEAKSGTLSRTNTLHKIRSWYGVYKYNRFHTVISKLSLLSRGVFITEVTGIIN